MIIFFIDKSVITESSVSLNSIDTDYLTNSINEMDVGIEATIFTYVDWYQFIHIFY